MLYSSFEGSSAYQGKSLIVCATLPYPGKKLNLCVLHPPVASLPSARVHDPQMARVASFECPGVYVGSLSMLGFGESQCVAVRLGTVREQLQAFVIEPWICVLMLLHTHTPGPSGIQCATGARRANKGKR